jgi:hypothetical protein
MQELIAILYLLIICLAFWGYGKMILGWLSKQNDYGSGAAVAMGISFFILICGYLELFHLASALVFQVFLAIGIALSLVNLKKIGFLGTKITRKLLLQEQFQVLNSKALVTNCLSIFISVICLFITIIYFYHLPLNQHDDFSGYLVLAKRILQEGYQGGDPFNDRSIEQGFGAGNYIIALITASLSVAASHLADVGFGIILLVLLTLDVYKRSIVYKPALYPLICIVIWCAVVINAPIVNSSPLIIAGGLFFSTISFYIRSNFGERYSDHVLLALLLSSFLVLKGNYIIPVCATGLCIYLSRLTIATLSRTFLELAIFSGCMLLFTLPWLIANWQFAQTPFYPLLGHGLVTPNALGLASLDQFVDAFFALLPYYAILISLLAFLHRFNEALDRRLFFFISTLSIVIILLSCALTMTSAGSLTRYSYVSLFVPIAFLVLYALFNLNFKEVVSKSKHNIFSALIFITVIGISAPQLFDTIKRSSRGLIKVLIPATFNMSHSLDVAGEQLRINLLQNSLPLGSTVLLRLDMPFLVDFGRGKFHVMDWPGNVGPKPGVPYDQSPEKLAQYLRDQGIQFIAYSYGNEALFSIKDPELASRQNHPNPWIRTQAVRTFAVQEQLQSLGNQYYRVFDNGQDFVIDLSRRAIPQIAK